MKDPEIEKIHKAILGLNGWTLDLAYGHLAIQRVLKDLLPTMTPEQQKIIRRYGKYKKEMTEEALIKIEDTNPRKAALLSSFLSPK
jgi:hypothetical protein